MSDKFVICSIDKNARLAGSSQYFILQTRKAKNRKWVDNFYYYSIGDLVRGAVRYLSAHNLKLVKSGGIDALMLLLDNIEKRIESFCDRMQSIFDSDPIERISLNLNEDE